MKKVIGIGETVFDIIFKNNQPVAAVPGGSVFNGLVSLGRAGVDTSFISEVGNDHVGGLILDFMQQSGVKTAAVKQYPDGASPISLAFLNEKGDAAYQFYKDYPAARLDDVVFPEVDKDDIVMFGSYFALNSVLRPKVAEFLTYARQREAILYYDINFRANHQHEAVRLTPSILENLEYADIVRGSADDFRYLYGTEDVDTIYEHHIKFYCPRFLLTRGGGSVSLRTDKLCKDYPALPIEAVSTIGAGDNFNAGVVYGLLQANICRNELPDLSEKVWDGVIARGLAFAAEVCKSTSNSVSREALERLIVKELRS